MSDAMAKRQWIAFYYDDYMADTPDLTREQHGCYLLLLIVCWRRGQIPTDPEAQATIAKCSRTRWKTIGPAVLAYFDKNGKNARATKEVLKAEAYIRQKQIAGMNGGISSAISRRDRKRRFDAATANATANATAGVSSSLTPPLQRGSTHLQSKKESFLSNTTFSAARDPPGDVDNPTEAAEPAEPKRSAEPSKKPSDLSRAELDALFAARKE